MDISTPPSFADLATKTELEPKSTNLDIKTKSEVKSAYFPKSSTLKIFAHAVKNIRPKNAFKTFPKLTKDTFLRSEKYLIKNLTPPNTTLFANLYMQYLETRFATT